jgi:hypothetical protein
VRCSISVHFGPGQSNTDDQASVVIRFLSVTESNRVHRQLRPRTVDARVPAPAMGARTPTRAVGCGRRGVPGRVHGTAGCQHRDADLPATAGGVQHRAGQRAVGIAFVSGGSGGAVGSGGSVGGLARTQTVVPIWVRPVLTCFRCVCPCAEPGLARGRARVPGSRGCTAAGQQRGAGGTQCPPVPGADRARFSGGRPGTGPGPGTHPWWGAGGCLRVAIGVLGERPDWRPGDRGRLCSSAAQSGPQPRAGQGHGCVWWRS